MLASCPRNARLILAYYRVNDRIAQSREAGRRTSSSVAVALTALLIAVGSCMHGKRWLGGDTRGSEVGGVVDGEEVR